MPFDEHTRLRCPTLSLHPRRIGAGLLFLVLAWSTGSAAAATLGPALQSELDRAVVAYGSGRRDEAYRQFEGLARRGVPAALFNLASMHLSGEVPIRIGKALKAEFERNEPGGLLRGLRPSDFDAWAVHAGGRTILDAVEQGFELASDKLQWSRGVLRDFGNMSSATLMFVLQRMLGSDEAATSGMGMAFGPGLAAETFRFARA